MKKTFAFLKALAQDPRIPDRDKKVLVAFVAYLVMPFDVIPDFIPIIGYADDLVVLIIVLDYIFNVIPEPVLLEHFPWDQKKYHRIRGWVRVGSRFIPNLVRRRLWKAARAPEE